jgi:hypothetical protein
VKRSVNISSYTSERNVPLFRAVLCGVLFTVSGLESQTLVFRPAMDGPFPIRSSIRQECLMCMLFIVHSSSILEQSTKEHCQGTLVHQKQ